MFERLSYRWALALALAAVFVLVEIPSWRTSPQPLDALRYVRGDTSHYLSILNSARVEGGPTGNAYYFEGRESMSQFYVFQWIIGLLPLVAIPMTLLVVVLKVAVAISVFFLLAKLLERFGVMRTVSPLVSFAFVLLYGPGAFTGAGLAHWFLPFLLLGMVFLLRASEEDRSPRSAAGFTLVAMVLFAVQPLFFVLLGLSAALIWFARFYESPKKREVFEAFLLWVLPSALIYARLFLPFMLDLVPGASETVIRMIGIQTHYPLHPIYALQFVSLFALSLAAYHTRVENRYRFLFTGAVSLAGFFALVSNVITGTYIANDHYPIVTDFLAMFLAFSFPYERVSQTKLGKYLGSLGVFVALLSTFDTLVYLQFRPGYYGKWFPLDLSLFALGAILLAPSIKTFFGQRRVMRTVLFFLVIGSLLYGAQLLHLMENGLRAGDASAESYRAVIEELRTLPQGVVLADMYLTNLVSVYTPHNSFWHAYAFMERQPNAELHDRYLIAYTFFPEDPWMTPEAARVGVYGNTNQCKHPEPFIFLYSLGFRGPYETFCLQPQLKRQVEGEALEKEKLLFREKVLAEGGVVFPYKLDYLVLMDADAPISQKLLDKYFSLVKRGEGFVIYRKR